MALSRTAFFAFALIGAPAIAWLIGLFAFGSFDDLSRTKYIALFLILPPALAAALGVVGRRRPVEIGVGMTAAIAVAGVSFVIVALSSL